jgi:hypothetical protein
MAGALVPGPTSPRARSESGIWTAQSPKDSPGTCSASQRPTGSFIPPPAGGDRPRGRQDLLDQPVRRSGPGREPGRLGSAATLFGGEDNPIGVAIDPAPGKIYWTDLDAATVRVGPPGGPHRGRRTNSV